MEPRLKSASEKSGHLQDWLNSIWYCVEFSVDSLVCAIYVGARTLFVGADVNYAA